MGGDEPASSGRARRRRTRPAAGGVIGKGEDWGREGKRKKVRSRKVANYRWKFVVVCWIVLDGQIYTCPN